MGLIREISCQGQIRTARADGNNLSIGLDQQASDLERRQRAAVAKDGIKLAVGVEPCQARHTSHHDLPIRLESECLWLVYVLAAEGDLDGSEGRIRDPGLAETKRFGGLPLEAIANRLGPNIVAVRLKDHWVDQLRCRRAGRHHRCRGY